MRHSHSSFHFITCSAALVVSFGCSSPGDDAQPGTGGSGQSASGGTAGSSVSGGAGGSGGAGAVGGASGSGGASGASGSGGASGASGSGGASGAGGSGGASGASGSGGVAGTAGSDASGGAGTAGAGGGGAGGGGNGGAGAGGAGSGGDAGKGGAGAGGASGAGAGGTGGMSSGMSSGCGKAPTIASNMYNNGSLISITAANMQRRYILNVPANYDNTKPYKLIIAFHQLDGNDKQMYANGYYHLLNLSNNEAIFVAPNGQKNGSPCTTTGNGDGGCGWPNSSNSDIALADAVVAQIEESFCIDTNRIFATGWSYGGSMSYKTACERGLGGTKGGVAGYIRGIAVYSGAQLSGNCTPTTPVAYYGSHGTSDSVLNYDGGVTLSHNFATANSCTWATPTKATSGHVCTDVAGCANGYPVKFCSFVGDHTPDPRDNGQQTSWEYQMAWDFISQF